MYTQGGQRGGIRVGQRHERKHDRDKEQKLHDLAERHRAQHLIQRGLHAQLLYARPYVHNALALHFHDHAGENRNEHAAEQARHQDLNQDELAHRAPLAHAGEEHADNRRINEERIPVGDRPFICPLVCRGKGIVVGDFAEEVIQDFAEGLCADLADELCVAEHDHIYQQRKEADHACSGNIAQALVDAGQAGKDKEYRDENRDEQVHRRSLRHAEHCVDAAADLHQARAHGVGYAGGHRPCAADMQQCRQPAHLALEGHVHERLERQRLFEVERQQRKSQRGQRIDEILHERPVEHRLADCKDRRLAGACFHACGNRRLHKVVDRLAHCPEQQAAADAAADRHGKPLPGGEIRLGILAADDHIAVFGNHDGNADKNADDAQQVDPPAEVIADKRNHLGHHLAKLLGEEHAEDDLDQQQGADREQHRLVYLPFLLIIQIHSIFPLFFLWFCNIPGSSPSYAALQHSIFSWADRTRDKRDTVDPTGAPPYP